MHPDLTRSLVALRQRELHDQMGAYRHHRPPRRFPLQLSWSRLSSRTGSALLIVISAHRA
jgi:hypothetical protein